MRRGLLSLVPFPAFPIESRIYACAENDPVKDTEYPNNLQIYMVASSLSVEFHDYLGLRKNNLIWDQL